jgi:hypothetical protein
VLILHQSCEIDFADLEDSRLTMAPIVASAEWPDAPWDMLRQNVIPGYFSCQGSIVRRRVGSGSLLHGLSRLQSWRTAVSARSG